MTLDERVARMEEKFDRQVGGLHRKLDHMASLLTRTAVLCDLCRPVVLGDGNRPAIDARVRCLEHAEEARRRQLGTLAALVAAAVSAVLQIVGALLTRAF